LPSSITERIKLLEEQIKTAIKLFKEIEDSEVALDDDSNGSHLTFWLNAISMYKKFIKENDNAI